MPGRRRRRPRRSGPGTASAGQGRATNSLRAASGSESAGCRLPVTESVWYRRRPGSRWLSQSRRRGPDLEPAPPSPGPTRSPTRSLSRWAARTARTRTSSTQSLVPWLRPWLSGPAARAVAAAVSRRPRPGYPMIRGNDRLRRWCGVCAAGPRRGRGPGAVPGPWQDLRLC